MLWLVTFKSEAGIDTGFIRFCANRNVDIVFYSIVILNKQAFCYSAWCMLESVAGILTIFLVE